MDDGFQPARVLRVIWLIMRIGGAIGKDASEAFEDVGHSDEARAMLPKMLLGEFKGEVRQPIAFAVE